MKHSQWMWILKLKAPGQREKKLILIGEKKMKKIKHEENYSESSNRTVYCIDFDHTLTSDFVGTYSVEPNPNISVTEKVKEKYMSGNIIIIWSARQWSNAPFLISWLEKYSVPYHGIRMSKGGSDFYVDDKNLSIKEFLE